jgi:hypothetical protein
MTWNHGHEPRKNVTQTYGTEVCFYKNAGLFLSDQHCLAILNIPLFMIEGLAAVDMKSSIFWVITPCNPLKASRRFGRI